MNKTLIDRSFQHIAEIIDPGAKLIQYWPLTGGVSAEITVLELAIPEGGNRNVVIRCQRAVDWKQSEAESISKEFALQRNLYKAGMPVPRPLLIDTSPFLFGAAYFVMDFIQGKTGVDTGQLQSATEQMADFLVRLHALEGDAVEQISLPSREDPLSGSLGYIPESSEWAALRNAIESWRITATPKAVLHGDFWPGNILWCKGKLAAVIDWEDAARGPAVSDLACARVELMVMYGESIMTEFTRCYLAASALDIRDLPVWEVYVSASALATMSEWGLNAHEEANRRQQTMICMKRAARELISIEAKRAG